MKKIFTTIIISGLLLSSCANSKKDLKQVENDGTIASLTENDGLKLLQQNCYACHSVNSTSYDAIIAPPMVAVVKRYKMMYQSKEAFVEGVTNWVINPTEEDALMRGAVMQFKVMPKQPFNRDEITTIAQFMYDNELEVPVWFESHFNNEHPNGMGNGFGNGKGKGKGRQ